MNAWRHGLAALLASLAVSAAPAQTVELAPSEALRCLTPPAKERAQVDFPFLEWKAGEDGQVHVDLGFAGPDEAPEVKVLQQQGGEGFVKAVREHVRRWRVPCMSQGAAPVHLVQEFVFRSALKTAFAGPAEDASAALRKDLLKCMHHVSGSLEPPYPLRALRTNTSGRVLVELTFRSPASAPEARVFARDSASPLRDEIESFVTGLRLPCLSGEVVSATLTYVFRIEDAAYGFKPLMLQSLLRVTKGLGERTLQMDTAVMGCPFDLSFTYRQPFMPNRVSTSGPARPERQALLDWLSGIELDLPRRTLDAVFADSTLVTVPCLKIDLKPQGDKS